MVLIENNINYTIYSCKGQAFLKYHLPGLHFRSTATLFLRGKYTQGHEGDPCSMWKMITGEDHHSVDLVAPQQVHGTEVMDATKALVLPARPPGDGISIENHDVWGSLRFADCFPVIMAFARPVQRIVILHSGFRGTLQNIAGSALEKLKDEAGSLDVLSYCRIFIGPGIGKCCYSRHRSDSLTIKAESVFPQDHVQIHDEISNFDLGNIIRHQILMAGVKPDNVVNIPHCTSCNRGLMYSYRRGDISDRMFLLAGIYAEKYQNCIFCWDNIL